MQMKKIVQLTITESCNLNCVYCYEKMKDCRIMDVKLAKSIIERSFQEAQNVDIVEFDFHGGEIALAFNEIKEICEWTWSKEWNKQYIFHATTNGTLIHDAIKSWFSKNSYRFSLGLSLDGTEEMHNRNRSNSYSLIDLNFFFKSWPHQTIKMTISPYTIDSVDKGVIDIVKKGFKLTANLAYGQVWEGSLLRKAYKLSLSRLTDFYLENPDLEPCNIVCMDLSAIGKKIILKQPNIHNKWCGSGDSMICYGIDGKSYPCQMFNPSSDSRQDSTKYDQLSMSNIPVKGCEKCLLLPSCPSCYGYGYINNGEICKSPDELCDFRIIETFASSYLYGHMLQNPHKYVQTRNLSDTQIACIAMGVKAIQMEYRDFISSFI